MSSAGMSSNFGFLKSEWPEVHEDALRAEELAHSDPRASCFYSRRALELIVKWLYEHDGTIKETDSDKLTVLLTEPTFRQAVGPAVLPKTHLIRDLGNIAVHSRGTVRKDAAQQAVCELFHISYWLVRTYARGPKPADGLKFDGNLLRSALPIPPQTLAQLQKQEKQLAEKDAALAAARTKSADYDAQLKRMRAEVAKAKAANAARPDTHDYSEAETRDFFIDLLLKESGWALDKPQDREFAVTGMPGETGKGCVDYVLWGDDGKPLALVETKRTRHDARAGRQQAKLYADCLEKQFGQRPLLFYSNGYEHWLWDDAQDDERQVQGFYKKSELELLLRRRTSRQPLSSATISQDIVERHYQIRAIRRVCESFERDRLRKALLVMATGAGKTRTVIALCDLLLRCNWIKRVLFLADRVALVNQAVGAFKTHLPSASPVNLVTEKDTDGRVYVSTYPTMMRLIDEVSSGRSVGSGKGGQRKFGVGHFDLVIIDEAHRSVYQKYRAIFEYFDSLLVGLTATPRGDIDHNTYSLFELEKGVPTDYYELDAAVKDGYLVPPKSVSVPLKFQRDGIRYADLSEEEKDRWDAIEWSEDGQVPERIEPEAVNKWLFNKDTVDKVLQHLMTSGLTVSGGDQLGKTIIFAKNHNHAQFIAERFHANYPHHKGAFARVIDFQTEYAQNLIDSFGNPSKPPQIAISVDMLDTGIDIPDVVNLVLFKLVRSKTKFLQMLGRGTRLRRDLFGPGLDKKYFLVFDFCQNLEFFGENPESIEGSRSESLGRRLFAKRLELIGMLDRKRAAASASLAMEPRPPYGDAATEEEVRFLTAELLQKQVAAMNLDNFIVRPQRRSVEKYAKLESWNKLQESDIAELTRQVAGLPSELADHDEAAKRFDLLMLRLQLALLRAEPAFARLRDQIKEIAGLLEEQASIPMVAEQMALLLEVQTDEYWKDITIPILEKARKRLRFLVRSIEKAKRKPIYTDFEDEIGDATPMEVLGLDTDADFDRFRSKARDFLRAHQDHLTIHKLRTNSSLTKTDLAELERILIDSGVGSADEIRRASVDSQGLGLFVRSLVGLDREAAKRSFSSFLTDKKLGANQIEFVNMIIDHLTIRGVMEAKLLYESPFIDKSPRGPEALFTTAQLTEIISLLDGIRNSAATAA